ncbi:facilitated trehalose transporter Tret1 [Plutella xylostella]|uniref:facilitated trehalose transporter Tret1 n=1 Tax=Plutella xylostella TaxID=51655 RepID=UPI0020329F67|nr:facilitated trehalose transporter Tret1 [Plutella xylostella]
MAVGMVFGLITASYLLKKLGRKTAHFLSIIPGVLGWVLIYFASDVTTLIIGRLLGGVFVMASFNVGLCVVSEYTAPETRGLLFSLKTFSFVASTLLTHLMGMCFHWRTVALVATVPLLASLGVTSSWPESPAWLLLRGERRRAGDAFRWLRGSGARAQREFQAMLQAQHERALNTQTPKSVKEKLVYVRVLLTKKEFTKPMISYIFLCVCLEASGRHVFPAYSTIIMAEILPEKMDASIYVLSFDVIALIGSVISCVTIKFLNRRSILFFSGIFSVVSLSAFSMYGYLIHAGLVSSRPRILVSILISYLMGANFGIATIPYVVKGELFPLCVRETGFAVASFCATVLLFVVLKVSLILFTHITVFGTFAVIALLLLLSLICLYFSLPETRNRTMQEIEDFFVCGKFIERQLNVDDPETQAMVGDKPDTTIY